MKNKALISAILTMVIIYILISFAVWDLNAKHWKIGLRVMYALFSPIFSALVYSSVKLFEGPDYK